jgi:hypothetical protein
MRNPLWMKSQYVDRPHLFRGDLACKALTPKRHQGGSGNRIPPYATIFVGNATSRVYLKAHDVPRLYYRSAIGHGGRCLGRVANKKKISYCQRFGMHGARSITISIQKLISEIKPRLRK